MNRTAGENQYLLSDTDRPTVNTTDIAFVVQQWDNEKENYDFSFRDCNGTQTCSHYTQLVWAWTFEVGCGRKRCSFVEGDVLLICGIASGFLFVITIQLETLGNDKPYRLGRPCSKCNRMISGPWSCENNLCVSS